MSQEVLCSLHVLLLRRVHVHVLIRVFARMSDFGSKIFQLSFQHDPGVYWYSWPDRRSLENFLRTNGREVITGIIDSVLDDLDNLLSEESAALRKAQRVVEAAGRALCDSLEDVAGPERETRDLTRYRRLSRNMLHNFNSSRMAKF